MTRRKKITPVLRQQIADWVRANESQILLEHVMENVTCHFDQFPNVSKKILNEILNETITF